MISLPIPIPQGYNIKVKVGDKIKEGDVIAESEISESDFAVDIASQLSVNPKKTSKYLLKKPGDRIKVGDLIAKKGGVFGSREIEAQIEGTAVRFEEDSGTLFIRSDKNKDLASQLKSPVEGTVTVCDNAKIVLKTEQEGIAAVAGSGESISGEVHFIEDPNVDPYDLEASIKGKIVVGKFFTREAFAKSIGLGVIGVIAHEDSGIDFENLSSKNINTCVVTVNEEGFKKVPKKGKLGIDPEKKLIIKL